MMRGILFPVLSVPSFFTCCMMFCDCAIWWLFPRETHQRMKPTRKGIPLILIVLEILALIAFLIVTVRIIIGH